MIKEGDWVTWRNTRGLRSKGRVEAILMGGKARIRVGNLHRSNVPIEWLSVVEDAA